MSTFLGREQATTRCRPSHTRPQHPCLRSRAPVPIYRQQHRPVPPMQPPRSSPTKPSGPTPPPYHHPIIPQHRLPVETPGPMHPAGPVARRVPPASRWAPSSTEKNNNKITTSETTNKQTKNVSRGGGKGNRLICGSAVLHAEYVPVCRNAECTPRQQTSIVLFTAELLIYYIMSPYKRLRVHSQHVCMLFDRSGKTKKKLYNQDNKREQP